MRSSDEDHPTASALEEMVGDRVAGAPIVDADQIIPAAIGVRYEVPVEEDDGDAGLVQRVGDTTVDGVFLPCEFQRREKDAGYFFGDELTAGLCRLLLNVGRITQ